MIHGAFDRMSGNRPQVLAELRIDALGVGWTRIRALIDTGAVYSAVHADTAFSTLRIDRAELLPENWPESEKTQLGGVGGNLNYRRLPATWRFTHHNSDAEDSKVAEFKAEVHLGEHRDGSGGAGASETNGLETMLGWDVLRYFRLTLDHDAGDVMLEPRPSAGT